MSYQRVHEYDHFREIPCHGLTGPYLGALARNDMNGSVQGICLIPIVQR